MKIKLIPTASNKKTSIAVSGDILVYDGIEYDFSSIPDSAVVEAEYPAIGVIKRVNGVIHISLTYLYDSKNCIDEERFPKKEYYLENKALKIGEYHV